MSKKKTTKMKINFRIKTVLFSMIIALFATSGCDNEEDNEPSKTDLLVKEWNVISIDGEIDMFEAYTIKFEANGSFTSNVTDEGELYSHTGQWSWGANETTINIVENGDLFGNSTNLRQMLCGSMTMMNRFLNWNLKSRLNQNKQ